MSTKSVAHWQNTALHKLADTAEEWLSEIDTQNLQDKNSRSLLNNTWI